MNLQALFHELRRRHVVRVAACYAAVGFLIVEIANNFFPALSLPSWANTLVAMLVILGFPVAVVLAWAFELTPDGVRRAEPVQGVASAGRGRPTWSRRLSALALLVLLAAGGRLIMERRAAGSAATDLGSVAVLPFATSTTPDLAYTAHGAAELLTRALDGAGRLRAVDQAAVHKAAGPPPPEGYAVERAAAVAREVGAGLFIVGTIHEVGGQVRIHAALHDAFRPDPPLQRARKDGAAADALELIDLIAAELVAGRRFGAASAELARAAAITTSSAAALRAYLEAEDALRVAAMESAIANYQRAIAEDSAFALAYYRLGTAYWWAESRPGLGTSERHRLSRHAAEQAALRKDRLGERDRRLLEAFGALHRGVPSLAEELYLGILRDYPGDVEARFQLADLLHHWNPVRGRPIAEAVAPFDQVLAADPEFACPI